MSETSAPSTLSTSIPISVPSATVSSTTVSTASSPICREFVNTGICTRRGKCRFHHPVHITKSIKKQATRQPGQCYCGASQRCLVNSRRSRDDEDRPVFFVVCGKTGKSMKKCM